MKGTADKETYLLILKVLKLARELTEAGYGDIKIAKVKEWR